MLHLNAVFGKVGRIVSPDVVVQLAKTKCLPVLCYGIEVCPANKSDISLDFFSMLWITVFVRYSTLN